MKKSDVFVGEDYAVAHKAHDSVRWRCVDINDSGVGSTFGSGPLVMKKLNPETGEEVDEPAVRMHGRDLLCPWRGYEEGWQKRNEQYKAKDAAQAAVRDALVLHGIRSGGVAAGGDNIGVLLSLDAAHELAEILGDRRSAERSEEEAGQ